MPHKQPTTSRLEAFSDGVIAVIITIMVLELKVPHQNGPAGLYSIAPILSIYLLSFAFTGIYWINHQHLLERIKTADRATLYANLVFLFCLSLLPFSTSYVLEKEMNSFAIVCYAVSMIATGFAFLLLRLAIHRNLRHNQELEREDRLARNKHLLSLLLYACSIPLAFYHPLIALALIAGVTVMWVLPDLAVPKERDPY